MSWNISHMLWNILVILLVPTPYGLLSLMKYDNKDFIIKFFVFIIKVLCPATCLPLCIWRDILPGNTLTNSIWNVHYVGINAYSCEYVIFWWRYYILAWICVIHLFSIRVICNINWRWQYDICMQINIIANVVIIPIHTCVILPS